MAADVGTYATRLLKFVSTHQQVADALMRTATLSYALDVKTGLSPEAALAEYGARVERAVTAVLSTTDPAVLAKFARDARVGVRKALAANGHIDYETARHLLEHAFAKKDWEMMTHLCSKVRATDFLELERKHRHGQYYLPTDRIVAEAIARGEPAELEALLRSGYQALVSPTLKACRRGKWKAGVGLPFRDALGFVHPDCYATAVAEVLACADVIDEELADAFLKKPDEIGLEVLRSRFYYYRDNPQPPMTAAAFRKIVGVAKEGTLRWLCGHQLPAEVLPEAVEALAPHATGDMCEPFVVANGKNLTKEDARRFVDAVIAKDALDPELAKTLLQCVHADLTGRQRSTLAAAGLVKVCAPWLRGAFTQKPRPGEVADAVAMLRERCGDNEVAKELSALASRFEEKSAPLADEFVDACGELFIPLVVYNDGAAEYLAQRFEAVFGDDTTLWDVALRLMPDWSGSVGELIDVAYLTLGLSPPAHDAEDADADSDAEVCAGEQLALL